MSIANTMKKSARGTSRKRGSNKRELIAPKGDERYIKRDSRGRIKESDDQSRSLSRDRKKAAMTKVKPGYGDKGDRRRKIQGSVPKA